MSIARHARAAVGVTTDQELAAAPGAGKRIAVHSVYVSSNSVATFTFESSNTSTLLQVFAATNSSQRIPLDEPVFCNPNENLAYSVSATSSSFVHVGFTVDTP